MYFSSRSVVGLLALVVATNAVEWKVGRDTLVRRDADAQATDGPNSLGRAQGVQRNADTQDGGPGGPGGAGGREGGFPSGFKGFPGFPKPSGASSGGPPAWTPSSTSAPAATSAPPGKCPQIWYDISDDLKEAFTEGADSGQCNDLARSAIRASFHDCGSWNQAQGTNAGCDGSLYLAKEYTRRENAGLEQNVPILGAMADKYGVGVADFFQFAGAHAVVTCPLGPTVKTFVGRKDRWDANPEGLLPDPHTSADTLLQNMADKGFSAAELAALLGAHSTSKQFEFDPSHAGAPLDDTPGVWDTRFYGEVLANDAPFIITSDKVLAFDDRVMPTWKSFVNNQVLWNQAYSPAMTKMSLLGVVQDGLIDCTDALPPPQDNFAEPGGLMSIPSYTPTKYRRYH